MNLRNPTLLAVILGLMWLVPSVTTAQQLDPALQELINKGVQKSHNISINRLKIDQSKIDQQLAKSTFLPKLTLNSSYTRLNDDITFGDDTRNLLIGSQKLLIKEALGVPFNSPLPPEVPVAAVPNLQDKNLLKAAADLEWVLFSGFQVTNALKASQAQQASLEYLGVVEEEKIALEIIEAYDKLALVNASRRVLNSSEENLRKQENYVRKAIENGLATPISRQKIELAQQQLASKELEYTHNRRLLIELLHQLTGADRAHLTSLEPQLDSMTTQGLSGSIKRNEIQALEEAEQATTYKSAMEKSNFIPKVAIRGHYEFLEDDLSLLDPRWYVGIGVKWNAFDGFQSRLKSEKAALESQQYREQIEEAEEKIALSIVKAQLNYESSLQNIQIARKEIDLASATYDMVDKQYRNDLASITEVLDALTELERANFKLQQAYFNQRRAVTNLLHAKGTLDSLYNKQ